MNKTSTFISSFISTTKLAVSQPRSIDVETSARGFEI